MAVEGHQNFMTKTQHYRKVTKPLLERKRRARMNLYLDELKDLIVDTMEAQGEQITKLEKADILEMTVNYLKSHKHNNSVNNFGGTVNMDSSVGSAAGAAKLVDVENSSNANGRHHHSTAVAMKGSGVIVEKYRAGYIQAAYDVSKVFSRLPELDLHCGKQLLQHLGQQLNIIKADNDYCNAKGNVAGISKVAIHVDHTNNIRAKAVAPYHAGIVADNNTVTAVDSKRMYPRSKQPQHRLTHQSYERLPAEGEKQHELVWRPW